MTTKAIIAAGTALLASATQSLAIEGLQISSTGSGRDFGMAQQPGRNLHSAMASKPGPGHPLGDAHRYLPADPTTNWQCLWTVPDTTVCVTNSDSMMMIRIQRIIVNYHFSKR